MHKVSIPKWAVDRVIERRGTAHPYADLDPARTALIVVDLQNGFMVDGVAHALCPMAVEIVPNVNRLAAAVRRTGGKVVWIKNTHDQTWVTMYVEDAPRKGGQAHRVHERGHGRASGLSRSRDEAGRHDGAEVALQRVPARAPPIWPSGCAPQGCDTVLIVGTMTNVCCESSARDAMMMNFHTIMVSDANAAAYRRGAQRLAGQFLRHVRRRHGHRFPDRLPGAQRRPARSGGLRGRRPACTRSRFRNGRSTARWSGAASCTCMRTSIPPRPR